MVVRIEPATSLTGSLTPPPDKSISHRAALVAAMCERPVQVRNYLRSEDTAATLSAVEELGAAVEGYDQVVPGRQSDSSADLVVRGVGLRGARSSGRVIDVGNAGTLLRMLPGWLAGQGSGRWTIDGDESIRRRPVDRVVEPLRLMGARIDCRDGQLAPITVEGSSVTGIVYELPVASAQVKSCVLFAGLLAEGRTTVVERDPSRDHTELMLELAGAPVMVERDDSSALTAAARRAPATTVTIEAVERLALDELDIPGDFSSAAFPIAAATIVPGSEITLNGVGVNPSRTGLLDVMERMGASVEITPTDFPSHEPVADVRVRHCALQGTTVTPAEVPRVIDELPLVALLGVFAEGITTVSGAEELRRKESDRIVTVVEGLRALGARIEGTDDGFTVEGTGELRGGQMRAEGDHRLAMLGAIAALASRGGAEVHGFDAVSVSYPAFGEDLAGLRR